MKQMLILLLISLAGCTAIPSVQSCDTVRYARDANKYSVMFADCRVMNADLPLPGVK